MSITDELRAWAKGSTLSSWTVEHLTAIADRIDAEHERAVRELNNLASACVLLPKDADGEYIHIGDVMDSRVDYLFDGKPFTVRALVLCEDGWEVGDGRFGNRYEPDSLRHHHEPTVEDVLRDMHAKLDEVTALYVGEAIDSDERDSDEARIFAEYASKLRLTGDAE